MAFDVDSSRFMSLNDILLKVTETAERSHDTFCYIADAVGAVIHALTKVQTNFLLKCYTLNMQRTH